MTARTSGLQRDINLVKRRSWLFIPFFILGILVAIAFGSFAGKSNAVATMQLNTVVHEALQGGDRGFRIFEAQQMTMSPEFKQKVVAATGDPNFDYSRFAVSLQPISVGDGVAEGTLTVSIKDDVKANAEKYRQAFVDTFTHEYRDADGLFRTRFVGKTQEVADQAAKDYRDLYAKVKTTAQAQYPEVPIDQLIGSAQPIPLLAELSKQ